MIAGNFLRKLGDTPGLQLLNLQPFRKLQVVTSDLAESHTNWDFSDDVVSYLAAESDLQIENSAPKSRGKGIAAPFSR